jgi:integrase/recombinase XerD
LDKNSGRGGIRTRDHWLRRPAYIPGSPLAQPVLDTYLLRRRMGGITESWATDIEYWLTGYLDELDWILDEEKTYKYLDELKEYYSASSYRKRAYQIRHFLQSLNIHWAEYIKPPPEPQKVPKRITTEIIQDTLNHFKGHPYEKQMKALILLGASSGMRSEELYQLTPDDIDLDNCIITINHDPDNGHTVKTGKSRIVLFNNDAKQALVEYLSFFNNGCTLSYLFGDKHIQRLFKDAPIRVKDLRKYFSQEWDRRGGPTSIKKMLMGHSGDVDSLHYNVQSIDDLKQIYTQVS